MIIFYLIKIVYILYFNCTIILTEGKLKNQNQLWSPVAIYKVESLFCDILNLYFTKLDKPRVDHAKHIIILKNISCKPSVKDRYRNASLLPKKI
ncbi:hypothetical protein Cycma_2234 [Cyclobacterium marinum DSM 745]|uniref:Uncharacterized protein n=1 Tax=Cyclobacterium marinum (strain ATCC 25205 / DSM 745 / LMG 13164 / NCIMB 1802) TaxID=880070 RepID=G0J4Y2_CYCMS|nr:hypothetical protein Cycma_2234 [Cyclobacterium marinum DSM 745]